MLANLRARRGTQVAATPPAPPDSVQQSMSVDMAAGGQAGGDKGSAVGFAYGGTVSVNKALQQWCVFASCLLVRKPSHTAMLHSQTRLSRRAGELDARAMLQEALRAILVGAAKVFAFGTL